MDLSPRRLRADNFTPPARTPWGGRHIRRRYKSSLGLADGDDVVGESWEISVEPSFPSMLADEPLSLDGLLGRDPRGWLGDVDAERHGSTPLLVKLLDAADALSVQVHPRDDDPALEAGESGKPEAWIVVDAEPDAGLYLGFRDGVERGDVERCIAIEGALDALMSFVPVSRGDAFVIDAGTAHAIGAGVTLIEPQLVLPGRRGSTYRFWDWNRRYDEAGRIDPAGAPRALHLERSLAVTAWDGPRGEAFVAGCRSAREPLADGSLCRERVVGWSHFDVERWHGHGSANTHTGGTLVAVTCLAGRLSIEGAHGALALAGGESGVVAAASGALRVEADDVLAFVVRSGDHTLRVNAP